MRRRVFILALLLICSSPNVFAQLQADDLRKLTIEELLEIDVASVSRRQASLARTAAAVTVLRGEDLRRLGVTSIPEALRTVPGLQVARASAGGWAVSARGFTNAAANKLLVLIDGRTVYSPIFSGVFWDIQDLVLEDVDHIEIVRGPGATLYGANAINGIINIITKSAHATRSNYAAVAGGGETDLLDSSVRIGRSVTPDVSYRLYGRYLYRDESRLTNGDGGSDASRLLHTGFRMDVTQVADDWTVAGDLYSGLNGILGRDDAKVLGGYVRTRWDRKLSSDSSLQVQMYAERNYRRVPLQSDFNQRTFDIEFQHEFALRNHTLVWGAEYRWNKDSTRPTAVLSFDPQERTYPLATGFVQDEVSMFHDAVRVLIGSKFEHNDFSGYEAQPSIRADWQLRPDHNVWAGVLRAVRTPTRFRHRYPLQSPWHYLRRQHAVQV